MKGEELEKVILYTRKEVQLFHVEKMRFMYFILVLTENIKLFTRQPTRHVLETQILPNKKILFFFPLTRKKYQVRTYQEKYNSIQHYFKIVLIINTSMLTCLAFGFFFLKRN